MKAIGPVGDIVRSYESSVLGSNNIAQSRVYRSTPLRSQKYFTSVSLTSKDSKPNSIFRFGDLIYLTVDMDGSAPRGFHFVEWSLYERSQGFRVAWGSTCAKTFLEIPSDCQQLIFRIGPVPLSKGTYTFSLAMGVAGVIDLDSWSDAITFEVYECNPENDYEYTTQFGPLFIPYSVNLSEG
jgi:hypothetical protein